MTRLKPFEQKVIHSCCGREICGKPPLCGDRYHAMARAPEYGLGLLRFRREMGKQRGESGSFPRGEGSDRLIAKDTDPQRSLVGLSLVRPVRPERMRGC